MAKSSVTTRTVKVVKVLEVETEVKTINLQLTEREAALIKTVMGKIGGSGELRELVDKIYFSLKFLPNMSQILDTSLSVANFDEERLNKFDNTSAE